MALFGRVGWPVPSFAHFHPGLRLVVAAMAGGLLVSLLARWSPEIRGHGIPEAMEAVLTKQSRIRPRTAFAKPLSAAIAIGTGGPFGAEGPIIVTGGALGSLLGQVLPVSPSERKILLACGAAAGMAATFGTPLAAVVLAIELLLFEFSARAFVPLVVSSALAGGVHSALFGTGPLFAVPAHNYNGLDKLPLYALLGVVCGLAAVVITNGLFVVEAGYRRLPVSQFWHPVIGALGFALIGLVEPRALGVGYDAISDVLTGRIAVGALAALAAAKLAAWWIALASGTSGGTLAPVLLISGSLGSLVGVAVNNVAPGAHVSPGAFALVAMAATFGAAVRATFTSIVFLFELTRDYQIILPLMLASVLAELVASRLLRDSLMTEKLTRRGLRVGSDYAVDVLDNTLVRQVMATSLQTLPADGTVATARRRMATTGHGAYPLVDADGRCVGIVARQDLLKAGFDEGDPLSSIATRDVVSVRPDDSLLVALEQILTEEVGHLPVIADGRLVGMCTRTDILHARRQQLDHEHLQPGWQPALRRLRAQSHRHAIPERQQEKKVTSMRRYLIVANQTLGGQELTDAIHQRMAGGPCQFHVLVPATDPKDFYGTVLGAYSGAVTHQTDAVAHAHQRLDEQLALLRDVGAQADGEVGDPDPLKAIGTVLPKERFDEIILSTLPAGISRWLHMDLHHRLAHHFDLPVTHVEAAHPGDHVDETEDQAVDNEGSTRHGGPDQAPATASGITADLDELERHINQVRADVAKFHHQGERHFIDQGSSTTDPALQASVQRLKFLAQQWHATSRQVAEHDPNAPDVIKTQDRLRQLQRHIEQVRRDIAESRRENERHFID